MSNLPPEVVAMPERQESRAWTLNDVGRIAEAQRFSAKLLAERTETTPTPR